MIISYFMHETDNIGDDIQSLILKSYLPVTAVPLNRDQLQNLDKKQEYFLIANGWLMHRMQKQFHFPYPENITPVFISIHICQNFRKHFNPLIIAYFKKYAPIGCRDQSTFDFLQSLNIPCVLTGCITRTADRLFPSVKQRSENTLLVDIPKQPSWNLKQPPEFLTHKLPMHYRKRNHIGRLEHARSLLLKYQSATAIITSRLHCALPALAFKTPVLLIHSKPSDDRFGAINHYLEIQKPTEVKQITTDDFVTVEHFHSDFEQTITTAIHNLRNPWI